MDPEEDSIACLKFLNETPTNYFLNGTEVGINDSIFTDIETTDWPAGFPVLLSSALNQEEIDQPNDPPPDNPEIALNVEPTIEISDGDETALDNNVEDNAIEENLDGLPTIMQDEDIIQILNMDGTIITINKMDLNLLNVEQETESVPVREEEPEPEPDDNYQEFYETVRANKCRLCGFICESLNEISMHLHDKHTNVLVDKELTRDKSAKKFKIKHIKTITSLLNKNVHNQSMTLYLCSECTNGYSDKEKLKQHMIIDHKLAVVSTDEPNPDTNKTPLALNQSIKILPDYLIKKQIRTLKKFKCTIKGCSYRFPNPELRKQHEDCHVNDQLKQFQCTVCDQKFSIWRICNNHLWKQHQIDLGLICCPVCNTFKSTSSVIIMKHMAIHNTEKPFLCCDCGKGFKQLAQLRNHEVIHRDPKDVPSWAHTKQCNVCQRFFANAKVLKKHIQAVHEKFKPFICNICGHKAARKAMLQLHLRQHTGVKPHACTYCNYKTGDHNCLRRHTMRHLGASNYTCPYCDYSSIQSFSYKRHLSLKHPGMYGNFTCAYCSYSTVNVDFYTSHVRQHELNPKEGENKSNNLETSLEEDEDAFLEDETQNCFLNADQDQPEDAVDTGGITIPAGLELHLEP